MFVINLSGTVYLEKLHNNQCLGTHKTKDALSFATLQEASQFVAENAWLLSTTARIVKVPFLTI